LQENACGITYLPLQFHKVNICVPLIGWPGLA
jgi:hypothetical protein